MMMMSFLRVWLTDEKRLALFPAGTMARDPHLGESPTRREPDGMHPMHKLSKDGAVRTA